MHHPTDRITHTTAFVTPVVEHWLEREIVQWVHPMKDRSDDPSHHERTLLPRERCLIQVNTIYKFSIKLKENYSTDKTTATYNEPSLQQARGAGRGDTSPLWSKPSLRCQASYHLGVGKSSGRKWVNLT